MAQADLLKETQEWSLQEQQAAAARNKQRVFEYYQLELRLQTEV